MKSFRKIENMVYGGTMVTSYIWLFYPRHRDFGFGLIDIFAYSPVILAIVFFLCADQQKLIRYTVVPVLLLAFMLNAYDMTWPLGGMWLGLIITGGIIVSDAILFTGIIVCQEIIPRGEE